MLSEWDSKGKKEFSKTNKILSQGKERKLLFYLWKRPEKSPLIKNSFLQKAKNCGIYCFFQVKKFKFPKGKKIKPKPQEEYQAFPLIPQPLLLLVI